MDSSEFSKMFVYLLLILGCALSEGRVYTRCELAKELLNVHKVPPSQVATWVCIADRESNMNTSAVGRLNADDSADHGIFQISDKYWCSPKGWACGLDCTSLEDDDIADDWKCARRIYREHQRLSGDGFNAWAVYQRYCKSSNVEDYIKDCSDEDNTIFLISKISTEPTKPDPHFIQVTDASFISKLPTNMFAPNNIFPFQNPPHLYHQQAFIPQSPQFTFTNKFAGTNQILPQQQPIITNNMLQPTVHNKVHSYSPVYQSLSPSFVSSTSKPFPLFSTTARPFPSHSTFSTQYRPSEHQSSAISFSSTPAKHFSTVNSLNTVTKPAPSTVLSSSSASISDTPGTFSSFHSFGAATKPFSSNSFVTASKPLSTENTFSTESKPFSTFSTLSSPSKVESTLSSFDNLGTATIPFSTDSVVTVSKPLSTEDSFTTASKPFSTFSTLSSPSKAESTFSTFDSYGTATKPFSTGHSHVTAPKQSKIESTNFLTTPSIAESTFNSFTTTAKPFSTVNNLIGHRGQFHLSNQHPVSSTNRPFELKYVSPTMRPTFHQVQFEKHPSPLVLSSNSLSDPRLSASSSHSYVTTADHSSWTSSVRIIGFNRK